ncbi:MAG: hypothetical protein JST06_08000 [Bacteroidetes bacterium]|nr:hypothetical protein [Bacteroidota bacterium]MBS1630715.1 hypothetical protein [Bacteroidota bacterium]
MEYVQYDEPSSELSQQSRTFARMISSLSEEAEAIKRYEQRMSIETNGTARAIMALAQLDAFRHFNQSLEFLLKEKPEWCQMLQTTLESCLASVSEPVL